MLLVSLWRLGHQGPGVIISVGLFIIIGPGRIVFGPDSSCKRVLFLLIGFVAIDGVEDYVELGEALANLGIEKCLSSCKAGGYSGGSISDFCGCFVNLLCYCPWTY
jgi:hypothetical protein